MSHKKTIKINGLVENKQSWKARRHQMHLDNQKFESKQRKREQEDDRNTK